MQTEYETIEGLAEHIKTRADFERFLQLLLDDYRQNRKAWENHELRYFLSGLEGFTRDMTSYAHTTKVDSDQPSWRLFATMLLAARVYE